MTQDQLMWWWIGVAIAINVIGHFVIRVLVVLGRIEDDEGPHMVVMAGSICWWMVIGVAPFVGLAWLIWSAAPRWIVAAARRMRGPETPPDTEQPDLGPHRTPPRVCPTCGAKP